MIIHRFQEFPGSHFRTALLAFAMGLFAFAHSASAITIELANANEALPGQAAPSSSVVIARVDPPSAGEAHQWLFNDVAIPGATAPSLTLGNVSVANSGNYHLRVSPAAGDAEDSNAIAINVLAPPSSPVDSSFRPDLPTGFVAARILGFTTGGAVIVTDDAAASTQVAILRADGTRVSGFSIPESATYRPIAAVLTALPDGSVIVPRAPFRLSSSGASIPLPLPADFDPALPLAAAAVQSDGKILLAQGERIARLNADASPDVSFNFANPTHARPERLEIDLQGRILLIGAIVYGSTAFPPHRVILERLTPTGAKDPAFTTFAGASEHEAWRGFQRIYPLADGSYLGLFRNYTGNTLLRVNADGVIDATWKGLGSRLPVDDRRSFRVAVDPAGQVFAIDEIENTLSRYVVTPTGLERDRTFYPGDFTTGAPDAELGDVVFQPNGWIYVTGTFVAWDAHPTPSLARLRSMDVVNAAPSAVTEVSNYFPRLADEVTLTASIIGPVGVGPYGYQWLALDGQPLPADRTSRTLIIPAFTSAHFGRYQVRVTNAAGATLSSPITLSLNAQPMVLRNISGRAAYGTGEDTMIAGVTAAGGGVTTLLRAIGPGLADLGVTGTLINPAVDVFDHFGRLRGNNDQWSVNPATASIAQQVGAFPLAPGSPDAALVYGIFSSATIHLKSQDGGAGVALLEIYEALPQPNSGALTNLSLRARTGEGDRTAIAGFVIADPQGFNRNARILLRAVGPTLAASGIQNPLTDPVLTVYSQKGERVAVNDHWFATNGPVLAAAMKQVGAFALPETSKDSALLLDLPAGAYSMHATGGSGVVLLEIYLIR